jgi:putative oxidoreductase
MSAFSGVARAIALGFLTPLAAALVFSVMRVPAVSAHVKQGFFVTSSGYEYTLVLGVAGLTAPSRAPVRSRSTGRSSIL